MSEKTYWFEADSRGIGKRIWPTSWKGIAAILVCVLLMHVSLFAFLTVSLPGLFVGMVLFLGFFTSLIYCIGVKTRWY